MKPKLMPPEEQDLVVRRTGVPVADLFLNRWSPRAFDGTAVPMQDLHVMLEAARWAPSAYNVQPWRFVYALRGDPNWPVFLSLLDSFNHEWAQYAGALVFVVPDTVRPGTDPARPFPSHSFDTGAAWAQFALQARMLGYVTHAMGGIHTERVRKELNVPARFKVEIGIAVGRQGTAQQLPAALQAREYPSDRMPLRQLAYAGCFPADMASGVRTGSAT